VCVSTVHEEPVLASVHKPMLPSVNELLDSTFSILDRDNQHQHRLITVHLYCHTGVTSSYYTGHIHSGASLSVCLSVPKMESSINETPKRHICGP